jgi:hypothetical protein
VVAASFFTLLVLDGTCYTFGVFMEPLRFIRNEKKDLFGLSLIVENHFMEYSFLREALGNGRSQVAAVGSIQVTPPTTNSFWQC